MTKIIESEQYKEYYFYKQKGFYAIERKEIPLKFKPFDIIRHYEPLNFPLPTVTNEQVEKCKEYIINEAKKHNFTLKYTDEDYHYLTQCKEIKKEAEYFLIGKFDKVNGEISTLKNGFVYKYLAVLDYEYLYLDTEEFYELIRSKLSKYSYMIYKSVSYTEVHPRFRVIVDTSREMNEGENLATLKNIVELIGIEPDPASFTYSQIQGLPLIINGGNYEPIVNYGEPYPVQEAVKQENKIKSNYTASNVQNNSILVSDEAFKKMFERYLEIDYENIKPGTPNEYNKILNILFALSRDVCYKVISYEVACECSDLLANIGATPDKYKQDNLNKINHAINSWKNNPNYFENEKSYSMLDKFKIIGDEPLKNEAKSYSTINISSNGELFKVLSEIGDNWRNEHTIVNEKTGNKTVPIMKFYTIGNILKDVLPMKLTGETEDTALIYSYDFNEGIYTGQETFIERAIASLEYRFNPDKYSQVYKYLKTQLPFLPRLEDSNLIAVNNGIFNIKTKQFEPFNPNYFITSKLATNYNEEALKNIENIKEVFDVDRWLNSIACGNSEIVKLYWEIFAEAINPNHTREKMVILYGEGNNGKGTFQTLITNLIGLKNISTLTPHDFSGEFKLEMLLGKVCNIGDDISNKYLDDMSNLMSIVTGDPVTVNRKGKSIITARFKILNIFSANRLPRVRNKSQGTYRRLLIVPFNADFNGQIQDRRIKDKFLNDKTVLEYVLYKTLHMEYFERFTIPKVSEILLEEYKENNDYLYSFLKDWYIERKLNDIERVPLSLVRIEFRNYLSVNYYDYKFTNSFGKDVVTHLNNYYKNQGCKYGIEKNKIRKEDKETLKSSLLEAEYNGQIFNNATYCIVKLQ